MDLRAAHVYFWRLHREEQDTNIQKELDENQKKAAEHFRGPMMVLAGPGSGKTTVITMRVNYLIEKHHVNPASILVVTFTKAAARQMQERFYRLAGRKLPVTFGTFHAVFFLILKYAYGYRASDVVSEEQRFQFMRQAAARRRLESEDESERISSLLAEISVVKNSDLDLSHYYAVSCAQDTFRELYRDYQAFLQKNRLIDFDDMLVFCRELLEQRPDILEGWQKKWPWILIDEFQDINRIQYDVVRLLAARTNNLFLVGDDDQSIYRFRGAKPEIMLHVKDDFPALHTIVLGKNYRCPAKIVKPASLLIAKNEIRYPKDLSAVREGGVVRNLLFAGQREECLFLAKKLREKEEAGTLWEEMAVLYRTNRQPRMLMEVLMRYNIPFRTRERVPNLYDHWAVRDVLCYIRIARGSRKRSDFLRIMNRPVRYLSRDSLPSETVDFEAWKDSYDDMEWMRQRLVKLETDLAMIGRLDPFGAVNYIRKAVDYDGYLKKIAGERGIDHEELTRILDELQDGAKAFHTFPAWFSHIEKVREELEEQKKRGREEKVNAVTLSTLHGAKGLEYQHVYIIDVNEGILPYRKSVLDADLEEERRLLYVGMTRAKEELTLCSCKNMNNHEVSPSRFLEEITGSEEPCGQQE